MTFTLVTYVFRWPWGQRLTRICCKYCFLNKQCLQFIYMFCYNSNWAWKPEESSSTFLLFALTCVQTTSCSDWLPAVLAPVRPIVNQLSNMGQVWYYESAVETSSRTTSMGVANGPISLLWLVVCPNYHTFQNLPGDVRQILIWSNFVCILLVLEQRHFEHSVTIK